MARDLSILGNNHKHHLDFSYLRIDRKNRKCDGRYHFLWWCSFIICCSVCNFPTSMKGIWIKYENVRMLSCNQQLVNDNEQLECPYWHSVLTNYHSLMAKESSTRMEIASSYLETNLLHSYNGEVQTCSKVLRAGMKLLQLLIRLSGVFFPCTRKKQGIYTYYIHHPCL